MKVSRKPAFSGSDKPRTLFFLLINVKMQTNFGILIFMTRKYISCSAEHEIFITSDQVNLSLLISKISIMYFSLANGISCSLPIKAYLDAPGTF